MTSEIIVRLLVVETAARELLAKASAARAEEHFDLQLAVDQLDAERMRVAAEAEARRRELEQRGGSLRSSA